MDALKQNWLKLLAAAVVALGVAYWLGFIPKVHAGGLPDRNKPIPVQNVFADAPVAKLSWTGFYVGGFAGYSVANGEISDIGFSFDGLSATGMMGGATVGADWQLPGSGLVLRARGSYAWSDQQFSISMGGFSASARMDDGWSADAGLGVAMGTALPYAMVGYGKYNTSLAATGSPGASGPDLEGMHYTLGVEWRLANLGFSSINPTLALEYTYQDFDSVSLGGTTKLDIDNHTAKARLNLRFFDGYKPAPAK